ncbi:type I-B CRISPR-associated protein Cas5b [Shouchella clausii]|uniref:Type I-B CRISPR-associated protein Cas5 n=1 Tax=Shouchella clausii TaxID=79880 RepID=A0A268P1J0_SHOCL|nr:type I-B CRISPR-associated protein Cas5b [Shouchella clausii]PAE89160.1 type I-B CRISPR-associated protein Cas5 [Shouchella clausii]
MKVLRLKLYQETACYKKPFAFKVSETYPLPPYSTVKGMLHAALNATSLIPMRYSIQGKYDTLMTDYQTHYFFKKSKTEEFVLTTAGLGIEREFKDLTSMPIYMHLLYDVELLIHVSAEEEVLHQLKEAILSSDSHLSLGRWEDLVRVDECDVVEVEKSNKSFVLEEYTAYVPKEQLRGGDYFPYKLNSTYRSLNGSVRVWDKISVGYVQQGYSVKRPMLDEKGSFVFLA